MFPRSSSSLAVIHRNTLVVVLLILEKEWMKGRGYLQNPLPVMSTASSLLRGTRRLVTRKGYCFWAPAVGLRNVQDDQVKPLQSIKWFMATLIHIEKFTSLQSGIVDLERQVKARVYLAKLRS